MSIELNWQDNDKTILIFTFVGSWTWEEFYPVLEQSEIMTDEMAPQIVHAIVDLRQNQSVPSSILTHLKNIADKQQSNAGLSILVTNNRFVLALFNTVIKIHGGFARYFRLAGSIEAALEVIAEAQANEVYSK